MILDKQTMETRSSTAQRRAAEAAQEQILLIRQPVNQRLFGGPTHNFMNSVQHFIPGTISIHSVRGRV